MPATRLLMRAAKCVVVCCSVEQCIVVCWSVLRRKTCEGFLYQLQTHRFLPQDSWCAPQSVLQCVVVCCSVSRIKTCEGFLVPVTDSRMPPARLLMRAAKPPDFPGTGPFEPDTLEVVAGVDIGDAEDRLLQFALAARISLSVTPMLSVIDFLRARPLAPTELAFGSDGFMCICPAAASCAKLAAFAPFPMSRTLFEISQKSALQAFNLINSKRVNFVVTWLLRIQRNSSAKLAAFAPEHTSRALFEIAQKSALQAINIVSFVVTWLVRIRRNSSAKQPTCAPLPMSRAQFQIVQTQLYICLTYRVAKPHMMPCLSGHFHKRAL